MNFKVVIAIGSHDYAGSGINGILRLRAGTGRGERDNVTRVADPCGKAVVPDRYFTLAGSNTNGISLTWESLRSANAFKK